MYSLSTVESVFSRSLNCQLDWPSYDNISQEELNFPIAYFMTVYADPR